MGAGFNGKSGPRPLAGSVAVVAVLALSFGFESSWTAAATTFGSRTKLAVVSSATYGTVLIASGAELEGAPIYEFSGDVDGRFGCGTTKALGFDFDSNTDVTLTCTGPMADYVNNVASDDWPALTTTGAPIAGPGVQQKLLGTVHRPGIGNQVTYNGHPLYLFDNAASPFAPHGVDDLETVEPLPPWHGTWFLVSAKNGLPVTGPAMISIGTLPNGQSAVALEGRNAHPINVILYSYSRDTVATSACTGACAAEWIPVYTTGTPKAVRGIEQSELGVIRRPDGSDQATYGGQPLYQYSREKGVFHGKNQPPQFSGTAGNGNGLPGPGGGTFSRIPVGG